MEILLTIHLRGKSADVLRDAGLLQEFLQGLPTASEADDISSEPGDWPSFTDGLLIFQEESVTVTEMLGRTLTPLLQAHGSVVTRESLVEAVVAEGKRPNEAMVRISRLRSLLQEQMPAVAIESAGAGYRISIKT